MKLLGVDQTLDPDVDWKGGWIRTLLLEGLDPDVPDVDWKGWKGRRIGMDVIDGRDDGRCC